MTRGFGLILTNLKDLKAEAPEFDGDLNPKKYLDWVQSIEGIFELKGYNDEKSFKLDTLKMEEYVPLWYQNLKKTRVMEAKSMINTSSKFYKHMDKRFLLSSYKQELYLKITSRRCKNRYVEAVSYTHLTLPTKRIV